MAALASIDSPRVKHRELTISTAIRRAWQGYLVLLTIPFLLFVAIIWWSTADGTAVLSAQQASMWFLACMAYLLLAVPAALFWRGHVFRAYWHGRTVSPGAYLRGMLAVWMTIEVGGIAALVGCLLAGSMLPNLLPALIAFMLFTPLWPSGHAMTRPVGNEEDPGTYEDPR